MPGPNETIQGSHLMKYHAHDRIKGTFTVKNSWDVEWGEDGYGELPNEYPVAEWWIVTDYAPLYDILQVFIGNNQRVLNGKLIDPMDVTPFIRENRAFTPTRHTHSPFGDIVKWDSSSECITIMRPKIPVKVGV